MFSLGTKHQQSVCLSLTIYLFVVLEFEHTLARQVGALSLGHTPATFDLVIFQIESRTFAQNRSWTVLLLTFASHIARITNVSQCLTLLDL
jgi:hypothetical protein